MDRPGRVAVDVELGARRSGARSGPTSETGSEAGEPRTAASVTGPVPTPGSVPTAGTGGDAGLAATGRLSAATCFAATQCAGGHDDSTCRPSRRQAADAASSAGHAPRGYTSCFPATRADRRAHSSLI
jgi:hypothetical protein